MKKRYDLSPRHRFFIPLESVDTDGHSTHVSNSGSCSSVASQLNVKMVAAGDK